MFIFTLLVLGLILFQVSLCFSILDTFFACDYVASRFFAQFLIVAGWNHLLDESWYMMHWFKCKSYSFLHLLLSSSGFNPRSCLAAFDIGKSDLADLLCIICMGDCRLLDNGVLWLIIKHLNISFLSSFAL